jgi:hypothetical protein
VNIIDNVVTIRLWGGTEEEEISNEEMNLEALHPENRRLLFFDIVLFIESRVSRIDVKSRIFNIRREDL